MVLDKVRARFPDLVGYILFFGAPLGIVLGTVKSGTSTGSTWGSEIQLVPSRGGRRPGGHPGRMGLRSVDGESKSFSSDRGPYSS